MATFAGVMDVPVRPAGAADPLQRLAGHAAAVRDGGLDAELERHARRALLDWFAAMLPGCTMETTRLLVRATRGDRGTGQAVCYADGSRTGIRTAALLNGTASHNAEFDDIHRDSGLHPGSPTIAATLAAAQAGGVGMRDFLAAVVAGYEVGCRIGMAVQPSHYRFWHITGTVGTLGAAAGTAAVLGLDRTGIAHAVATAASFTGGLQAALRGSGMSKPLHSGHAAEAGALAALAAREGVTGAADALHGPVGFAAATSDGTGNWDAALDGMGRRFAIAEMTFKNHGCCGHIFAALDAVAALRAETPFGADDVAAVHVEGYRATRDVCDRPDPRTAQEARFSVQFCVATMLRLGGVRLRAFEPANLHDAVVRRDMEKVTVAMAPDLADAYPRRRPARITLTLRDGRVLRRFQPTRIGDPDAPLDDDALLAKFTELAVPALGADGAARLAEAVLHGDQLPGGLELLPG